MRSYLYGTAGMLAVIVVFGHCGGAVDTLGQGGDASVDGRGGSGGSEGGNGSGSGGSSTSSGSSGSGSGSSSNSSGSGGGSGSGSSSGGAACTPACDQFTKCCNSACINPNNDPLNCGGCGISCTGDTSYCDNGQCEKPPCSSGAPVCDSTQFCCAEQCCNAGQICCNFAGPQDYTACFTPTSTSPTCPVGCGGCVSDRNDLEPVDPESVLERVSRMPITTWSYKSDDPSVRHMGMMAQDFYEEFSLGNTDKGVQLDRRPRCRDGRHPGALPAHAGAGRAYPEARAGEPRAEATRLESRQFSHWRMA